MSDPVEKERPRVSVMFATNKDGKVFPRATNVYRALSHHDSWLGVLRHNELTETDEYHGHDENDPLWLEQDKPLAITDEMVFGVRCWLEQVIQWSSVPGKDLVFDSIAAVAKKSRYHPVRDYLAPLASAWDGTERIDHWLSDYCGAADSTYTRAISRKTLIGAAARAFTPGVKLDTMLVLIGRQGVRKSTLIRVLGRDWVSDTPIEVGGKDGYEAIRGAWLVEFAELAGMGGRDVERLKAFFSSPVDVYRPPYGRKPVSRPRSCAFIGSTNDVDFLKDATGSRRFWCVEVGDIDIEAFSEVIDQVWAEAALCALRGDPWWLSEEEDKEAQGAAERFTVEDDWEGLIRGRLAGSRQTKVHTAEIYEWLEIDPKDRHAGHAQRIVRIMHGRLGWSRPAEPFRHSGKRLRGFCAPQNWHTDTQYKEKVTDPL